MHVNDLTHKLFHLSRHHLGIPLVESVPHLSLKTVPYGRKVGLFDWTLDSRTHVLLEKGGSQSQRWTGHKEKIKDDRTRPSLNPFDQNNHTVVALRQSLTEWAHMCTNVEWTYKECTNELITLPHNYRTTMILPGGVWATKIRRLDSNIRQYCVTIHKHIDLHRYVSFPCRFYAVLSNFYHFSWMYLRQMVLTIQRDTLSHPLVPHLHFQIL